MADTRSRCACGHAPRAQLSVNPAVPPSVDVIADGPDGGVLLPVLVLPGARICVDGFSTDSDAAEWWKELAVAALYASLYYQGASESTLREPAGTVPAAPEEPPATLVPSAASTAHGPHRKPGPPAAAPPARHTPAA